MIYPQQPDQKWRVSHNGEPNADLFNTHAINLSKQDRVAPAKKPVVLYSSADDTHVGLPLSIVSDESFYYIVTNDGVYQYTVSTLPTFAALTTTNAVNTSLGRDGVIFNGNLNVGGGDLVKYYSGGAWNAGVATGSIDTSYPIRLCVFENKVNLAVGNKNKVYLYDTSYSQVSANTLTIPIEYIVTGLVWRQNQLYILTRNVSGGTAKMFVWNGAGTSAQYGFGVQADWIYSGCEYDNTIAVITSAGQLLRFNGGGFDELANLPVYDTPYSWSSSSSLINGTGKVATRGMLAIGKRLLINLDGSVTVSGGGYPGVYMPNQPSGIWEYNPTTGLNHKAGYCTTKYSALTVSTLTSNVLGFGGTAHNCVTGDAVYMDGIGSLTGLVSAQTYFAIYDSITGLKLALSPADAAAGNAITIGGTPGGAAVCTDAIQELGNTLITAPGAIGTYNKNIQNTFFGADVLFGGECPNHLGTNIYSIMTFGMGQNRSSLTTSRMLAPSITANFGTLLASVDNLTNTFESIVVKYRTKFNLGYPTQVSTSGISKVTWTNQTTFTAPVANRDLSHIAIGDELTIIQGAGAGYTAHITSCSSNGTTWTVVLDETIPGIAAADVSEIQVDNWTKITSTAMNVTGADAALGLLRSKIDGTGAWMQLKIELRGRDLAVRRLSLPVKPQTNQS